MRGNDVVVGFRMPAGSRRGQFESSLERGDRRQDQILERLQGDGVEPDHTAVVVGELRVIVIVMRRGDRMRPRVPVDRRVGVVVVGLVNVLRCQDRRKGNARSQDQAGGGPAEGKRHAAPIMGVGQMRRQPFTTNAFVRRHSRTRSRRSP